MATGRGSPNSDVADEGEPGLAPEGCGPGYPRGMQRNWEKGKGVRVAGRDGE